MKKLKETIKLPFSIFIISQIAYGVNFLHNTLKIAHRDLKPENVFIFEDGEGEIFKLGDFGLGKDVDTLRVNIITRIHKLTNLFHSSKKERIQNKKLKSYFTLFFYLNLN